MLPILGHLTTIDTSFTASWHQRHRYENTTTLVCNDDDRQAGPMRAREDFVSTTRTLTSLRKEQGRQKPFIPKNERVRQRPFDEALRADQEWQSQKLEKPTGRNLPLQHLHSNGGNANTKALNGANIRHSMARSQLVERVMATDSFEAT